eukprot:3935366-Rhodomonas_salina.4
MALKTPTRRRQYRPALSTIQQGPRAFDLVSPAADLVACVAFHPDNTVPRVSQRCRTAGAW